MKKIIAIMLLSFLAACEPVLTFAQVTSLYNTHSLTPIRHFEFPKGIMAHDSVLFLGSYLAAPNITTAGSILDSVFVKDATTGEFKLVAQSTLTGGSITGNPTQILYFDNGGAVTSDANFYRTDSTTWIYNYRPGTQSDFVGIQIQSQNNGQYITDILIEASDSTNGHYSNFELSPWANMLRAYVSNSDFSNLFGIQGSDSGISVNDENNTLYFLPATSDSGKIAMCHGTGEYITWEDPCSICGSASIAWGLITGTLSDQTDLQSALDAKAPTSRTISTTSPLSGGGDLSANRTFSIADAKADGSTKGAASFSATYFDAVAGNITPDFVNGLASGSQSGWLSLVDWTAFNNKQSAITFHTLSGTPNQVSLSAAGTNSLAGSNDITLSLPQDIATSSNVNFATYISGSLTNNPASSWVIAGRQAANNRPTLVLQRFTDTSPTGDFISCYDIAATPAKKFNVDITGALTAGSIGSGFTAIANSALANSSITINGVSTSLGSSTSVTDASLSFSDITTNNSSTSNHGFLKKLSNSATQYMDGTGNWSTPAGSGANTSLSNLSSVAINADPLPGTDDARNLGDNTHRYHYLPFKLASGFIGWGTDGADGAIQCTGSSGSATMAHTNAAGGYTFDAAVKPASDDGAPLGSTSLKWSDIFLASGGVINWNSGNATLTHTAGNLTSNVPLTANSFIPSSSSVPTNGVYLPAANTVGIAVNSGGEIQVTGTATSPVADDGNALGTTSNEWSDLFLASGGVINWANGNASITHATGGISVSAGTFKAPILETATSTSNTVTFTSSQYGQTYLWSPTGTATATLPANGAAAGSWFDVIILTNQTTTISAATADTLIVDGDTAADSVAFSTTSHKIGSAVRFISNGSVWIAINLGSTTMTIAT